MLIHHYRDLLHFCLRKVPDRDTAADLAQETFARVLAMQQAGEVILDPRALLRRVALRAKIDLDRRAEVRQHDDIDALDEAREPAAARHLQPDEACASSQSIQAYLSAIESLPPRCREAFCMYAFDELPNQEIADRMGVSLGMVNQYISRGKLACAARRDTIEPRVTRAAMLIACCAAIFVSSLVGWQWWRQPIFQGQYVAERGQRLQARLPDGTELSLDVDTQVQVTLYRNRREVCLAEGQLLLAVAPDRDKPFDVLAGAARVTVVGTRFEVRHRQRGLDAGAVSVSVEEGKVRVGSTVTGDVGAAAQATELTRGQGISVSAEGVIGQVVARPPSGIGLWRKDLIRFEDTPLAEALAELERHGPTRLVIRDPAVAAMTIGGSYPVGRPDELARVLPWILPVRLVVGPDGLTEVVRAR